MGPNGSITTYSARRFIRGPTPPPLLGSDSDSGMGGKGSGLVSIEVMVMGWKVPISGRIYEPGEKEVDMSRLA